jgi:hypothetical protein
MLVESWFACAAAHAPFMWSAIGSIENRIGNPINLRKQAVGPENNDRHDTKVNFLLRG